MGFLSEFVNSYLFQVSVSSGLLWGGIIAALYRWAGRRLPDKEALNKRSIRVLFILLCES
jgi:hypothetical protein